MKRSRKLLLLAVIFLAGVLVTVLLERFVMTPDGVALRSELAARHLVPATESGADAAPVLIDFDLLDEARPLDLIDLSLEFPESLRALEGKRVRLLGFMAPYDSLNDMRRCMIVPSYVGCSFCTPPSLTQVVYVRQADRASGRFPFIEPPSDISGILRLPRTGSTNEGHQDGFVYVIEDAVVTPYLASDAPSRAPGHGSSNSIDPAAHLNRVTALEEISLEALASEVEDLRELPAKVPLKFERIPAAGLVDRVREEAARAFSSKDREAFLAVLGLLGFFEEPPTDWIASMTSLGLTQRIAWVDETGERIEVLDTVSTADPFSRLELVKEIADALARQHFPAARPPLRMHADSSRALEALRQGNKQLVAYRYARRGNLSPATRPPEGLFSAHPRPETVPPVIDLWHWLPWETGPFFVEARTGATKGLSRIDELFRQPPASTRELFRPSLYPGERARADVIPADFAADLLPEAPVFVERLGLGGLIPWLSGTLPVDQAKAAAGRVVEDRYALWRFPGGGTGLLLETSWPDRESARRFLENVPSHPHQILTDTPTGPFTVRIVRADSDAVLQRIGAALANRRPES